MNIHFETWRCLGIITKSKIALSYFPPCVLSDYRLTFFVFRFSGNKIGTDLSGFSFDSEPD